MIQVPISLEDLYPLEEPCLESDTTSDVVGVPEEGTSTLSSDAVPFTTPLPCHLSQVTLASLDEVNPCKPKPRQQKPYDRPPKGDPNKRTRAQKRNTIRNSNNKKAEKQEKNAVGPSGYKVPLAASLKFSRPSRLPLSAINAGDIKASKGAYQSRSTKTVTDTTILTVEECLRRKYIELEWDGRSTIVLVDNQNRILAVLVGRPDDPSWEGVIKRATQAMKDALGKLKFPCKKGCGGLPFDKKCKDCKKARGSYQAMSIGLSLGSGSVVCQCSFDTLSSNESLLKLNKAPAMLKQERSNIEILQDLVANKDIQRLAEFASACLAFYYPKLYQELVEQLDQLYARDSSFQRLFASIFPGATFNLGPQTITLPHYDCKNKGNGIVSLCSLGEFDHQKGGHLVFLTLKLFVQFPSGSTVLFPSAIVEHANTPIASTENRMSFTQWMAGGLFRWVDYGFQLKKECKVRNPGLYQEMERARKSASGWMEALRVFSFYDELQADHKRVFYPESF